MWSTCRNLGTLWILTTASVAATEVAAEQTLAFARRVAFDAHVNGYALIPMDISNFMSVYFYLIQLGYDLNEMRIGSNPFFVVTPAIQGTS